MLTLTKLTKTFSTGSGYSHKALDGLSLDVDKGDFITIVGSNGAGKSTLFNAICGDFFRCTSKPLRDFRLESNQGRDVIFVPTLQEAIDRLKR